ncbi:MAG TPA: glycosyltransferase [Gaiellaceae bacterium]|jgi:glycosyltransferase involved in cell wall biosynthesis
MRPILAPAPPNDLQPGPAPTFSIVTPAYQAAATIVETVESALAQTLPAHEIVIVDDGSTDSTAELLAPYRDRIVYIRQENRGTPAALNAGARAATGDFVSILDADDVYESERIAALTELAQARPDLDILATDAYLEANGTVAARFYEATPFASERQTLEIVDRCFIAWPAVRRSTLLELGGYDESLKIAHDWECYLRLLFAGSRAGAVDEPLMRYRIRGSGSLTDNRIEALRDRVRMLERALLLEPPAEERQAIERYLRLRRRQVLLAETEHALRAHRPDARRRSLKLAVSADLPAGTRARALAAAIAPRLAARRLAALERQTGHSYMKRAVPDR